MFSTRSGAKRGGVATASIATVLASLALVTASAHASGPPVNATSSTAPPPLVTDRLGSALPCNQKTQIGLDGCAQKDLRLADKLLNADITVLWGMLGSSSRSDFVAAQRSWMKYRRADCTSQSDVYEGGTDQPVEYVFCLAGDDASRRLDLKGFYALVAQGMSSPPKFP